MSERAQFWSVSGDGLTQIMVSLAIVLLSIGMLLGSFWLTWLDTADVRQPHSSVAEISPTSISFFTLTPSPLPSVTPSPSPLPATATDLPPSQVEETADPTAPSPSPTPSSSLVSSCEVPLGWRLH
ncbi:MAG TPA: hypothetical protein ENN19_08905, partial [Chloroflexi bacterium]|nr:hypothetical protein [Chloroflexota bacterium]